MSTKEEWGVRHLDGQVTVHPTGHAFTGPESAGEKAAEYESGDQFGQCDTCGAEAGSGAHRVVRRTVFETTWA